MAQSTHSEPENDEYDGWSDFFGNSSDTSSNGSSGNINRQQVQPDDKHAAVEFFDHIFKGLQRRGGNRIPKPKSSKDCFFPKLGELICTGPEVTEWLAATNNDCFILSLPPGLHNPLVVCSVVSGLLEKSPRLTIATVSPEFNLTSACDYGEYILSSICDQWNMIRVIETEIQEKTSTFFQGYSPRLREQALRHIFNLNITSQSYHDLACVVDLSRQQQGNDGFSQCMDTVEWMMREMKSADHRIKMLIILDVDQDVSLNTTHTATVSLDNKQVQESLVLDLLACAEKTIAGPSPHGVRIKDAMLPMIHSHIHQPMLVFSYIEHLSTRPWLSKAHLCFDNERGLSRTPGLQSSYLQSLVLDKVVWFLEREIVADILGFLNVSVRPMTIAELDAALCMARLPTDADQLDDEWKVSDLSFDLIHSLAGIVLVQDGQAQLLGPFWEGTDNSLPNLPWLHTRLDSNKKLATICLRYILLCSQSNTDHNSLVQQWPLIEYASTFWHHHYIAAYREEDSDKDSIWQMIVKTPGIMQSWLDIQHILDHSRPAATKTVDHDNLLPDVIAAKFHINFPDAVLVAARARQIEPVLDHDASTAVIWSVWLYRQSHIGPPARSNPDSSTWIQGITRDPLPPSLLKALPCGIEPTFLLCMSDLHIVPLNAKEILKIAVEQGALSVAEDCIAMLAGVLDFSFVSSLPLELIFKLGSPSIWEMLKLHWRSPDEARTGYEANKSYNSNEFHAVSREVGLMILAMKFGSHDAVEWLLTWLLECGNNVCPISNLLPLVVSCGCAEHVALFLEKVPDCVKNISTWKLLSAAGIACRYDRMGIFTALFTQDGVVRKHETETDNYLHFVVRYGGSAVTEMLEMLFDTTGGTETRKQLAAELSECIMEPGYADVSPLYEAARNGEEEATYFLLQHVSPDTDFSKSRLLLAAAESGKIGLVKRILGLKGIDISERGRYGDSALHRACWSGKADVVRELLRQGADAWMHNGDMHSPLWYLLNEVSSQTEEAAEITTVLIEAAQSAQDMNETLVRAAGFGHDWAVAKMLEAGADKNYRNDRGRGPLHYAAYGGNESTVRLLLQRQVDIKPTDKFSDTPINDAAMEDYAEIVSLLLDAGAGETEGARRPVCVAAESGSNAALEVLFKRGFRLPLAGEECPLEKVASRRDTSTMQMILDYQPEFRGQPILDSCAHAALRKSKVKILNLLFDYGADPNAVSAEQLYGSAIHECALYSNMKMVRMLLGREPQLEKDMVNFAAGQYYTPLIAAVSKPYLRVFLDNSKMARRLKRQTTMIAFLMRKGAKIDVVGGRFGSMLNAAAAVGIPDLIELVCGLGLPISFVDMEERSAAHMACTNYNHAHKILGRIESLSNAQDKETDLMRVSDAHGRKPLHLASGNSVLDAVTYILKDRKRAKDINIQDNDGWTPLHWACRQWDAMILATLVTAGADTNARTARPMGNTSETALWTPWDVAVFHGNADSGFSEVLGLKDQTTAVVTAPKHNVIKCDSCFVRIYGIRHTCETCRYYNLCNKCVRRSLEFHDPLHTFTIRETCDEPEQAPSESHGSSEHGAPSEEESE